jgi:hypothetical protein
MHVRKCSLCNESPGDFRGLPESPMTSYATTSREQTPISILMYNVPRCPYSWYVNRLHDRLAHALEEFMVGTGSVIKVWGYLRLEASCIRHVASHRDNHCGDVVCFDFAAPLALCCGCYGH